MPRSNEQGRARGRYRRIATLALVFLALGAATSYGLAWAFHFRAFDKIGLKERLQASASRTRGVWSERSVAVADQIGWSELSIMRRSSSPGATAIAPPDWSDAARHGIGDFEGFVVECAAGWPLRCARSHQRVLSNRDDPMSILPWVLPVEGASGSWSDQAWSLPALVMPTAPIWSGLAINMFFWGGVWFLLWAPLAGGVRLWRGRKNRCRWCGYDIRELSGEVCPECGRSPRELRLGLIRHVPAMMLLLVIAGLATARFWFHAGRRYEPIHIAACYNDVKTLKRELERGVDPDLLSRDRPSWAPLPPIMAAAASGALDAYEVLRDAGADLSATYGPPNRGYSDPLVTAFDNGHEDLALQMIHDGMDPVRLDSPFVRWPRRMLNHPFVLGLIDDCGPDVQVRRDGGTLLSVAFEQGYYDAVTGLVDLGASLDVVDADGRSLYAKIKYGPAGSREARDEQQGNPWIAILRDAGVAPDDAGMVRAAASGAAAGLRQLVELGGDLYTVDEQGQTLLFHAADLDVLDDLLMAAIEVNHRDVDGKTALHAQAARGRSDLIVQLIAAGADPTIRDLRGALPRDVAVGADTIRALLEVTGDAPTIDDLFRAMERTTPEMLDRLVDLGADLAGVDSIGRNLLFAQTHPMVLERLLDAGANMHQRDATGATPLHAQAAIGYAANVQLLLERGADPTITDAADRTPADVARFPDVEDILEKAVARRTGDAEGGE